MTQERKIDWMLLFVMILGAFFLGSKVFFIASFFYMLFIFYKNEFCLGIPKLLGFRMYLMFILYGVVVGFAIYSTRYVLRDLYYLLPTVIWIFIGYNLKETEKEDCDTIIRTIIIYGTIVSVSCFVSFAVNRNLTFNGMREVFGTNVYDVGFILSILITRCVFLKRRTFSKWIDRSMIVLMAGQIIFSFGRIALLEPIITILVCGFMCMKYEAGNKIIMGRIMKFLFLVLIVVVIAFYILPDTLTDTFVGKILVSFSEVDSSQEINSVNSAMNNWRAYEMQAAQNQWFGDNILQQIFGSGLGKGVEIEYVPYSWADIVENNEIPLLHNGFYTLLPKGGMFAIVALILIFVGSIRSAICYCRGNKNIFYGVILAGISVGAIANTWVVRGPVQQGVFLVWGLLVGYLEKIIHREIVSNRS